MVWIGSAYYIVVIINQLIFEVTLVLAFHVLSYVGSAALLTFWLASTRSPSAFYFSL